MKRTTSRQRGRPAYTIGDKVRTPRGVGTIKYVFPAGARSQISYSVRFGKKSVGTIYNEDQLVPLEKAPRRWR